MGAGLKIGSNLGIRLWKKPPLALMAALRKGVPTEIESRLKPAKLRRIAAIRVLVAEERVGRCLHSLVTPNVFRRGWGASFLMLEMLNPCILISFELIFCPRNVHFGVY